MSSNKFEKRLKTVLAQSGDDALEQLHAIYLTTKRKLTSNIYDEIRGADRDLSDHGLRHIDNVLKNAHFLLGEKRDIVSPMELYCLAMMVLFHDVGNLYGRDNHQQKIGEIFEWARGRDADVRREKTIVIKAAGAHTGQASDGSNDTLKELDPNDHLQDESVRLRELAAILRFSDELAEGPQRTSDFLRRNNLYSADSQLFHDYASITHIFVDRGSDRVLVTYEIDLADKTDDIKKWLRELLEFTYVRAVKLDQERRYAKYYSDILSRFRMTRIQYNFHYRSQILGVDLAPVVLDDKVIPGDPRKAIQDIDKDYMPDELIPRLLEQTLELDAND